MADRRMMAVFLDMPKILVAESTLKVSTKLVAQCANTPLRKSMSPQVGNTSAPY